MTRLIDRQAVVTDGKTKRGRARPARHYSAAALVLSFLVENADRQVLRTTDRGRAFSIRGLDRGRTARSHTCVDFSSRRERKLERGRARVARALPRPRCFEKQTPRLLRCPW